jgi:ABC-type polysaccharide/polyol phosphate export permease
MERLRHWLRERNQLHDTGVIWAVVITAVLIVAMGVVITLQARSAVGPGG